MLQRLPITLKALLATALVSITTLGVLDHWQTIHLKTLFHDRLKSVVGEKAQTNRIIFDQHIKMHHQTVNLLASQRNLLDYLEQVEKRAERQQYTEIHFSNQPPDWLPRSSVLRGLVPLRYLLLMEPDGRVTEVYQGQSEPPPPTLLKPSRLLRQLSHSQTFLTTVDETPFLITSETVSGRDGLPKAILMLANPLDDAFLSNPQGLGSQYSGIVALLEGNNQHIIASNKPHIAPPGLLLDRILSRFVVAGQSFFDYGASDLLLQLITLVPTESFESLSHSILQAERKQRFITASVLILACLFILLWITHNIQKATREVVNFSKTNLGIQPPDSDTRDELCILQERFNHLTKEIIQTRDTLQAELEERKRAEMEVRKLSQALEQSPAATVITDLQGGILYVNSQFSRLTGYSGEEVMGKNLRFMKSGETSEATYQNLWETIQAGQIWRGELHNRRKDGSTYWELNTISHIHLPDQSQTLYLAIKENISPRITMEKALKQAREAAETANQVKNDFLSNISHELRTPLNTITGCTTLLLDKEFGEINKVQRKYLKNIHSGADRLFALISDLLDLSKVNSDQFILEKRFFDLPQLVINTGEAISGQAEHKGLTFSCSIEDEVPEKVKGDPVRLRQILLHILQNALKFTQIGQINLTLTCKSTYCTGPGSVCFVITDTGIGIPEEKQKTIFDPFIQADSSSSRSYEGTGLGLTVAKNLIELMGGSIRLKSEVNEGSIFFVTIPFTLPTGATDTLSNPPLPEGLKTVVAGKNPVNRLILKKLLITLGLDVSELTRCQSPEELQQQSENQPWDFLCLDCSNSLTGGLEEIIKIRQQTDLINLPILLFGALSTEHRQQASQLPGVYCLNRPFQRNQLCRIIRQAIAWKPILS